MDRQIIKHQPIFFAFLLSLSIIIVGCGQQQAPPQTNDEIEQQTDNEQIDSETAGEESHTESTTNNESPEEEEHSSQPEASGELAVHYIDVGQGDATLLIGPNFTILIDAGRHDANDVTPYLRSQGVSDIDLMMITHPHSDHIGQADTVMQEFNVQEVWMSGDEHTSQTFEQVLDAILTSGADYHEPRAGDSYRFGSALVEVVSPKDVTGDLNEGSISVRITYGDIKFLFTGDAEHQTERDMINRSHDLQADIFQLGHHGSTTSNTQSFLDNVQPEVAIYSAGEGNSYGFPHDEIINRVKSIGIDLYGTDVHGHIIVTTDGEQYSISTNKSGTVTGPPTSTELEPKEKQETGPNCIDINTAPKEKLMEITQIGDARADDLIQLRPFNSVDDLNRIKGIGPGRVADIKDQGLACVQ
ncbi:MBL fold metallo-hydrolase [Alkalihalobacillus deserti]|uniref:MBL fold metallo-hydrolase n=1 Tax=Alkalihalobacillus deserti TaxID=2879466 RepID=UPI001D151F4D|nr:MBL fold metallo-hydrolase [Alkalihalobacillus deserti]